MEPKSKKWLWILLVVVVIAMVWWLVRSSNEATAPGVGENAGPALSGDDTTAAIEQELNATNLGDIETELQETDADLNSL